MTLSFTWATNALYSTGPDSGSSTKVDPASTSNGFIAGVIAAPQHVNYLFDLVGDELAKAVDGINGGTYVLTAPLRFEGADVQIAADLKVVSGGTITVASGGDINVASGGDVNLGTGADLVLSSGATATVGSGAFLLVTGTGSVFIDASEKLVISNAANTYRLTLTPSAIGADSGGTNPAWRPGLSATPFAGPVEGWFQHDVLSGFTIAFPLPLNAGDDISTVVVAVDGSFAGVGHAAKPTGADLPTVALVAVSGTGVATVIASRADQSANVTVYNSDHSITLSTGASGMTGTMPHTVSSSSAYYVVVTGETGANAEADKFGIRSISGAVVARSYRSALMTY